MHCGLVLVYHQSRPEVGCQQVRKCRCDIYVTGEMLDGHVLWHIRASNEEPHIGFLLDGARLSSW